MCVIISLHMLVCLCADITVQHPHSTYSIGLYALSAYTTAFGAESFRKIEAVKLILLVSLSGMR